MAPILTYNSKTIRFPRDPAEGSPGPATTTPRTFNLGQTGVSPETLALPRVDTLVGYRWILDRTSLRWELENWFHWAERGGAWAFALDENDNVSTTTTASISAGATSLALSSATGFVADRWYAIVKKQSFQVVRAGAISGTTLHLGEGATVDHAFETGATVRSLYRWAGMLRGSPRYPFRDRFIEKDDRKFPIFDFELMFHEAPA